MAGLPDLSSYSSSKPKRNLKPILLGAALAVIAVLGSGAYFLTRPCLIFECKEIHAVEELQKSFRQLTPNAKSEQELLAMQQQFETVVKSLKTIPLWSPQYQEAEQLAANLSGKSEEINQVVKALQAGTLAAQKAQVTTGNLEELQARQQLWRQAIAPLEVINSNSELSGLAQSKLSQYRAGLQVVNQQLVAEEKWLKKLTAAKAVALAATKTEATAKSLADLQKVQSTWQVAVNALNAIPQTNPGYQEAQKLLADYKPKLATSRDRATKELLAAKTYNQALRYNCIAPSLLVSPLSPTPVAFCLLI
ncbi:MAG: hypothetical protein ACHBN1_17145 [Heteroscytonema crispum UTEX LB 1556]